MHQEKRKRKRAHLIDYLEILDRETGSVVGHLADISPQGLMMVSRKPVAVSRDFSLLLQLPENYNEPDMIDFNVRSLWCKKDVNPEFFVSGFKFNEIADSKIKILTELINTHGFIRR